MNKILGQTYFGNTVWLYTVAAGIFLACVVIILIFKFIVLKRMKRWSEKTKTNIDNFIVAGIEKTVVPLLYYGALYIALNSLKLDVKFEKVLNYISIILVTFFIVQLVISILKYLLNSYLTKKGEVENPEKQLRGIVALGSTIIWGLALVFLLDNLGFKISAVIAGLGVGGIAIALAAQKILGDLFSYFVIFFDRPFQIGDFIILSSDIMGSVESIGIKSTKLRSLSGEQLIVSNTDLVNSRIHNYKRMERRRVQFNIGVVYQTSHDQLEQIGALIKQIITSIPDTTFDRAHFSSYGDFSLIFEIVYYVLSPDYNKFMDIQQEINLRIYKEFEARKIGMAFPTQTLYLNKLSDNNEPKTEVL